MPKMTKSVTKYKGEVIIPYDQSNDERITGDYALKEGACLGLCIMWIIKRKEDRKGLKFWKWMLGEDSFTIGVLKYAMVKQSTVIQLAKKSSGNVRDMLTSDKVTIARDLLAKKGIRKASKSGGQEGFMLSGYSTAVIGNSFVAQPGACCLLFMMGTGGGHVVAFYCGIGEYYFFDPNCGEILFTDYVNFLLWLDDFWMKDSGYKKAFQTFIFMYFTL
jgi:hypothetical protein